MNNGKRGTQTAYVKPVLSERQQLGNNHFPLAHLPDNRVLQALSSESSGKVEGMAPAVQVEVSGHIIVFICRCSLC